MFPESSNSANYRTIERVLSKLEANRVPMRLYDSDSPVILIDSTDKERSQAKNADYVGYLSDGKTLGLRMMVAWQP